MVEVEVEVVEEEEDVEEKEELQKAAVRHDLKEGLDFRCVKKVLKGRGKGMGGGDDE